MLIDNRYVLKFKPLRTTGMSVYPYSEEIIHLYSFKTAFDGDVCGAVLNGSSKTVLVPRESVPYADKEDYRVSYPPVIPTHKFTPRHEQLELCNKSINLLKSGRCHIFQAPTGHGKTVEGAYIACQMGQPTLIVVNKQDLVDQWRTSLINILGVSPSLIGHIQADVCDWKGKTFVIGMVQSLIIEDKYPDEMYKYFGMVIFDEVQFMAADCFIRSCQLFSAKYRLGLSATPTRKDGKTKLLQWHIGPVLVQGTVLSMKPKVLIRRTGWRIPTTEKLVGNEWVKVTMPFAPGRMMPITKIQTKNNSRNLEIVNFVTQAYQADRICLVMSDMLEHLQRLFQLITSQEIPGNEIGFYIGGMSVKELALTKKRRIVLGTYKMAGTGTDAPQWDSLVLATPRADIEQFMGRVLRSMGGKKQPVILDLVDGDSIFQNFSLSRMKQYYKIGAEVIKV